MSEAQFYKELLHFDDMFGITVLAIAKVENNEWSAVVNWRRTLNPHEKYCEFVSDMAKLHKKGTKMPESWARAIFPYLVDVKWASVSGKEK